MLIHLKELDSLGNKEALGIMTVACEHQIITRWGGSVWKKSQCMEWLRKDRWRKRAIFYLITDSCFSQQPRTEITKPNYSNKGVYELLKTGILKYFASSIGIVKSSFSL